MKGTNPKNRLARRKPQLHLIPPTALVHCARAFEEGAQKYGSYNWRRTRVSATIYVAAAMRHILAYLDGEDLDSDSGVPHPAKAMACMALLLDAAELGILADDRPPKGKPALISRIKKR